jgi:hypothetical protein
MKTRIALAPEADQPAIDRWRHAVCGNDCQLNCAFSDFS